MRRFRNVWTMNSHSLVRWSAEVSTYLSYLGRVVGFLRLVIRYLAATSFSVSAWNRDESWLISERGLDARDNAFHLFRYIREKHPEIDASFLIDSNSPDFSRVSQIGSTLQPNTLDHFRAFVRAEKLVSTHLYGAAPYGKAARLVLRFIPAKHHVFLQHGVAKDSLTINDPYVNLLVVSSEREIASFSGSSANVIEAAKVVGLARYDALIDESAGRPPTILIMPTFRKWLVKTRRTGGWRQTFHSDPFFVNWQRLLESSQLSDTLEAHDAQLVFYLHHSAQMFTSEFTSPSRRVQVFDQSSADVQELLKGSTVLVTDYSSVAFDFAYMGKPVVYFQFDVDRFRSEHYAAGTYSYVTDGFGPVFSDADSVVSYLDTLGHRGFRPEEEYISRGLPFFSFRDNLNTRRNLQAILKLGRPS